MRATPLNALPSPSLSAQLYATLRERIILGQYEQGSRLPEARIAEQLNVSRIPLREAIPQLEVDGFVRTIPRRGAFVSEWSERTVNELFDVRLSLEVFAAQLASRRVRDGADVGALRAAILEADQTLHIGNPLRMAEASTVIHERIVAMADNALLNSLMKAVSGRLTWLFYLTSRRDAELACEEHHILLDVIASGDERLAEAVAYSHIERGRQPSIDTLLAG